MSEWRRYDRLARARPPFAWHSAPRRIGLANGEIHVGRASLDDPPLPRADLCQWLSADERARADDPVGNSMRRARAPRWDGSQFAPPGSPRVCSGAGPGTWKEDAPLMSPERHERRGVTLSGDEPAVHLQTLGPFTRGTD